VAWCLSQSTITFLPPLCERFAGGLFSWSKPMSQRELYQQIADSTGESINTIRNFGFSPLLPTIPMDERQKPLMIDWDLEDQFRERIHF